MPWITPAERTAWNEGRFFDCYKRLGAHPNARGTWFAVWAPNADEVSVIGDFNDWQRGAHQLGRAGDTGLWEGYVRGVAPGGRYKYHVRRGDYRVDKTDPYAFAMEPPLLGGHDVAGLSAVVTDLSYDWSDGDWVENRRGPSGRDRPMAVYEVHLGSWKRGSDGQSLSYREIAEPLADYVTDMGFTHIELMPVAEHPYYPSWGYQVVGYFAPTFRYGSAADLMYLVDTLHQRGVGVIVDWVPAHFATDPQGLVFYDGSYLYEYDDPIMRQHPDWGTFVFDYQQPGVQNFLAGNACYWFDLFHFDGIRVDAVASMLYRDYSRDHWTPNNFGGRENLEAIALLQKVNQAIYASFPEAITIAEESTAWPGVTQPVSSDGLGFLYKWNMGWMHDTLSYLRNDPIHRPFHHDQLTFPLWYAFSENYILPLSHDEVVHGKGSLWNKMPGDRWQKAANVRLLFGHMVGHPGKVMMFMGGEFGQTAEWNCNAELTWELTDNELHGGLQGWVRDALALYRRHEALWNDTPEGFRWVSFADRMQSVVSYVRLSASGEPLLFVVNFTPVPRDPYLISDFQIPGPNGDIAASNRAWQLVLNSDDPAYGGGGYPVRETIVATAEGFHLSVPPLAILAFEIA